MSMPETTPLAGQVAVVTGAGRGIGEGVVRRLAQDGATVVLADLVPPTQVLAELSESSREASWSAGVDIADAASVNGLVAEVMDKYGRIDILCNNAGIGDPVGDLVDLADDTLRRTFEVNVFGTFRMSRAVGHHMRAAGYGRIINIASRFGKTPAPGWGPYSASKAAILSLTECLALELARHGVTANAICPGTIQTPKQYELAGAADGSVDFDAHFAGYAQQSIPIGRMGLPADVAGLVAWLAGPDASFMTGATLNLSGGESVF